jgi:hypothetical protein
LRVSSTKAKHFAEKFSRIDRRDSPSWNGPQDGGFYRSDEIHNPVNPICLVGELSFDGLERRNWFIFDLTSLVGQTILSASLALPNPGYISFDATEDTLFEVLTSPAMLALGGGASPVERNALGASPRR